MAEEKRKELTSEDSIEIFCHCGLCLKELPDDQSPSSYARINVGWSVLGIQVWCVRHNVNIIHIDFEGQKHPADTTCDKPEERVLN